MIDPLDKTPLRSIGESPLSPQLAMRVAMLGGIALVLFSIIFFNTSYFSKSLFHVF